MGFKTHSVEGRELDGSDGSDGSVESIQMRDRPTSRPPSARTLTKRPRFPPETQQSTYSRGSFVHRWRQSSSSDLRQMGSPPLTPGQMTPMSLVTPSATWLPEGNRNSSLSVSPGHFGTPLVCYTQPCTASDLTDEQLRCLEKPRIIMAFVPRRSSRHSQKGLDQGWLDSTVTNPR